MFWIMFLLLTVPASSRAETVKIPDVMKKKWEDLSVTVAEGYQQIKEKIDEAGNTETGEALRHRLQVASRLSLAQSSAAAASRIWETTKNKGRAVVLFLDDKLHEKFLRIEQPSGRRH